MPHSDENTLSQSEIKALGDLRDRGFAVAVFTPPELDGAEPSQVEDIMVERGWDAIADLRLPDEAPMGES